MTLVRCFCQFCQSWTAENLWTSILKMLRSFQRSLRARIPFDKVDQVPKDLMLLLVLLELLMYTVEIGR
jgi:hypothetical protein